MKFKSEMVQENFEKHKNKFTIQQYEMADEILSFALKNYANGGDVIVESFDFEEIIKEFKTQDDAKNFLRIRLSKEKDCRSGEDNDPELLRSEDNWI